MNQKYFSIFISVSYFSIKRKTMCGCIERSRLLGIALVKQKGSPTVLKQKKSSVVCIEAKLLEVWVKIYNLELYSFNTKLILIFFFQCEINPYVVDTVGMQVYSEIKNHWSTYLLDLSKGDLPLQTELKAFLHYMNFTTCRTFTNARHSEKPGV